VLRFVGLPAVRRSRNRETILFPRVPPKYKPASAAQVPPGPLAWRGTPPFPFLLLFLSPFLSSPLFLSLPPPLPCCAACCTWACACCYHAYACVCTVTTSTLVTTRTLKTCRSHQRKSAAHAMSVDQSPGDGMEAAEQSKCTGTEQHGSAGQTRCMLAYAIHTARSEAFVADANLVAALQRTQIERQCTNVSANSEIVL